MHKTFCWLVKQPTFGEIGGDIGPVEKGPDEIGPDEI
jgi:hypothetical protein